MPFQIPILCYDNHVSDFRQTVPGGDLHDPSGSFISGIFLIKEAPVSDSTEEVPMTPGVIAQQNGRNSQPDIKKLNGLTQFSPQWDEPVQDSGEEKKKEREQRGSKRKIWEQQQAQQREEQDHRDRLDRQYQSYMTTVAVQKLQSQIKGEQMDPEWVIHLLQTGTDALTGGVPSVIHGITTGKALEDAVKGEDGDPDQKKENIPTSPSLHQPLRT